MELLKLTIIGVIGISICIFIFSPVPKERAGIPVNNVASPAFEPSTATSSY